MEANRGALEVAPKPDIQLVSKNDLFVVNHDFRFFATFVGNQLERRNGTVRIDGIGNKNGQPEHLRIVINFFNLLVEHRPLPNDESNPHKYLEAREHVISPDWVVEFFEHLEKDALLFAYIQAVHIKAGLFVDHAALFIASKLKALNSLEEMRTYLNLRNDFFPKDFDILAFHSPAWRERLIDGKMYTPVEKKKPRKTRSMLKIPELLVEVAVPGAIELGLQEEAEAEEEQQRVHTPPVRRH